MRGSESMESSSPAISLSCDSTFLVLSLKRSVPSQLDELLAPVGDHQLVVVKQKAPDLLALLLGRTPGDGGERYLHGGPLPEVLVAGLDHGDVLFPQPVAQGAYRLALVLAAGGGGKAQLQPRSRSFPAAGRAGSVSSGACPCGWRRREGPAPALQRTAK